MLLDVDTLSVSLCRYHNIYSCNSIGAYSSAAHKMVKIFQIVEFMNNSASQSFGCGIVELQRILSGFAHNFYSNNGVNFSSTCS